MKTKCKTKLRLLTMGITSILLPAFFFLIFLSCSHEDREDVENRTTLSVFVNIPPQAYFVEQIAGDWVDVNVLLPPGQDPHLFTPTPRQIMKLGAADLYFHGIMPFGRELTQKITSSDHKIHIVDITEGVKYRKIEEDHHPNRIHDGEGNGNGHGHAHDHHAQKEGEGMDPHVWLSPPEIKIQVKNIAEALIKVDPERTDEYRENSVLFLEKLDDTHQKLLTSLEPYRERTFYVYHPAFGYFARTYNLEQKAVETGGRSPTAKHLGELISRAKADDVRVIFVQPQFESKSAEAIAEAINGAVIPLDPLKQNVLDNLLEISRAVREALGESP